MPTLEEARLDATRLAAAGTVYRILLWLLAFAVVDVLATLARLGLTAAGIGFGTTLAGLPRTPTDYLAYLATPLAAAMLAIALAALIAKAALLWRIVTAETGDSLDPLWVPWVAAVVAVGCWFAGGAIAAWDTMWAARISTEYLAARGIAMNLSGLVAGAFMPLLWAGAAVASFYRLRAITNEARANAGPYREPA